MSTVEAPALSHEDRRALVRATSARTFGRRVWLSRLFLSVVTLAMLIAVVPLASIVYSVIQKGASFINWKFLSTSQAFPTIIHPKDIGGIWNAISGSILVDALAAAFAIPVSIVVAVALFEMNNVFVRVLRRCLEVMIGLPSILLGIFVYSFVVVPISHGVGTAYAGSLAIGLMMIPLMSIAGEAALRNVPSTLREAGLALGARPSGVMRKVLFPFALPRVLTGMLLALSRAVGETAPILFVIGISLVPDWNPTSSVNSLPLMIYNYLASPYPGERQACWGIALVLMAVVLVLNLSSRIIVARTSKGR